MRLATWCDPSRWNASRGGSNACFGNLIKATAEINESIFPTRHESLEYEPDSGGAGRHRGGLGQIMEFAHADGEAFAVSKMFDRVDHPARGRDGGTAGAPARVYTSSGKKLKGMGREIIAAGESMILETAGGGGRGKPSDRDRAATAADKKNGLVK